MRTSRPIICLVLFTLFLQTGRLLAASTNTAPIAVVVHFDNGKAKYEVDSKFVRSEKVLEALDELKKQKGGRDARVVVIVDNRNSLAALSNIRGIVDKAGLFNVRYFNFNAEVGRMAEILLDQPAMSFSLNPPASTR